jgi:sec-independent protein translocase protein TatA
MMQTFEPTDLIASAISPWHIVLVLAVVILLFGGAKIPELMKGVGKGVSEFKKGVDEGKASEEDEADKAKSA